jgi:hypothetical protein
LNHLLVQGIHISEDLFNLLALDLLYDGLGFDIKIVHHEERSLVVVHGVRGCGHIQLATLHNQISTPYQAFLLLLCSTISWAT